MKNDNLNKVEYYDVSCFTRCLGIIEKIDS